MFKSSETVLETLCVDSA